MPTEKLTAKRVESIAPTAGKRVDYFDAHVRGLMLRVTENGAKSWSVMYRHRGKLRRLTLGSLSDRFGLAEAREKAKDALEAVRDGKDPAAEKQQARKAETIADLITDYVEKYAQKRKRSWREDKRILNSEVLPQWRHKAIADIKRRDVRALVEPIAHRAPTMANRVLACVRKMFSYAVDQELIENNPAARLGRPGGVEQSRDRVLNDTEIRTLWASFDALSSEMGALFKLRLVTAQRGGEVASMRWQDVDLESGWWTVPATRSKNKLAHRVPLAATAIDIIKALQSDDAEPDDYVLAGARGRRQQTEAAATFTVPDFRGHDLRRTAASLMAGGGVSRLVISRILNHVETGVTAIYDRHGYDNEKRAALDWWALKLAAILDEKPAKVLAFTSGKGA